MNDKQPIPGFPGYYATRDGQVITTVTKPTRPLKQTHEGRYRVVMCGKGNRQYVHTLILLAFAGPRPTDEHQARYLDNDHSNVRADNLVWSTPAESAAAQEQRGSAIWQRCFIQKYKLNPAQVSTIKARALAGENQDVIAADFGITQTHVSAIKLGTNWPGVRPDAKADASAGGMMDFHPVGTDATERQGDGVGVAIL